MVNPTDTSSGITQAFLHENFTYDTSTGCLIRKVAHGKRGGVGKIAGKQRKNSSDYSQVMIHYRQYMAHRLIWLYVHGVWPANHLDHINGIKTDNRIENLREATRSQNMGNRVRPKHNTSGYKGVSWNKNTRKWQVKFRRVALGSFDDIVEAASVYNAAYTAFYGEFAKAA